MNCILLETWIINADVKLDRHLFLLQLKSEGALISLQTDFATVDSVWHSFELNPSMMLHVVHLEIERLLLIRWEDSIGLEHHLPDVFSLTVQALAYVYNLLYLPRW